MPKLFSDPEAIVDEIIRDVGKKLVVGLPLGLGKANHIVNALYARAAADPSIDLTLFSALTLEKPRPASLLEARFGGLVDAVSASANSSRPSDLPPDLIQDIGRISTRYQRQ